MRYADREVRARRRTAERVERTRKTGETGREKKCTCVEEKKSEEKLEGEEKREREREYSSLEWGSCEGYEGWCKGDGEAGGSASDGESQRLTKKKDGRFNSLIAQRSKRRRAG